MADRIQQVVGEMKRAAGAAGSTTKDDLERGVGGSVSSRLPEASTSTLDSERYGSIREYKPPFDDSFANGFRSKNSAEKYALIREYASRFEALSPREMASFHYMCRIGAESIRAGDESLGSTKPDPEMIKFYRDASYVRHGFNVSQIAIKLQEHKALTQGENDLYRRMSKETVRGLNSSNAYDRLHAGAASIAGALDRMDLQMSRLLKGCQGNCSPDVKSMIQHSMSLRRLAADSNLAE